MCSRFPAIFGWNFGWKLRTPNLGEDEAVGGRNGTVRNSVGEFLQALHSNFSSIFTLVATSNNKMSINLRIIDIFSIR